MYNWVSGSGDCISAGYYLLCSLGGNYYCEQTVCMTETDGSFTMSYSGSCTCSGYAT